MSEVEEIYQNKTDELFDLVIEYAKHYENGLSVKRTPKLFMNMKIELIEKKINFYLKY